VTDPVGPFAQVKIEIPEGLKNRPLGKVLLRYQSRTFQLMATTALLVIEKSRRIGLTWALAAKAALTAATATSAGGMDAWYMGYDKEMAREFIEVVAMFARAFNMAAAEQDEEVFEGGKDEDDVTGFRVRFASGHKVVALPSVARVLRGKQGLVIVDEAAFHKSLDEVIKAALALLIWGGQVVIVSTHDGIDNSFSQLLDEVRAKKRDGTAYQITFRDAIADGLYERVKLVSHGKILPKKEWIESIYSLYGDDAGEELDCIPKSGSGAWLKPEDVSACQHVDAGKPALYQQGLVYIGRDIAIRNDKAVIWPFELVGNVLWLRDRYEAVKATFKAQDDALDQMFADYRVASCWIDQTGMGEKVVEDAKNRLGSLRVTGQLFTAPAKIDLATSLRQRTEAGLIRWPNDPVIRADFRAIKRTGGSGSGLVETGSVHADLFWAAALACRAAEVGGSVIDFQSSGQKRASAGTYGAASSQRATDTGWGTMPGSNNMDGY